MINHSCRIVASFSYVNTGLPNYVSRRGVRVVDGAALENSGVL